MEDADPPLLGDEVVDGLEVPAGRPAAVVSQAPENRNVAAELEGQRAPFLEPAPDVVALGVIEPDADPVGQDLAAVHPPPAVEVGR